MDDTRRAELLRQDIQRRKSSLELCIEIAEKLLELEELEKL